MGRYATPILNTPNNFTLLRHVAAFFVLISHSYELLGTGNREPLAGLTASFISFSHIGLVVFFFISGLLVTQSLFNSFNIIHFFWKRILRIYPALIVLIFLTVFILGTVFTSMPLKDYFLAKQTWQYFLGGVTLIKLRFYLPGVFNGEGINGSLWSLPVEFRLYLLLAFLYIIARSQKKLFLFFIIFSVLFFFIFPQQNLLPLPNWLRPYTYWGVCFFTGSLVYLLKEKIRISNLIFVALIAAWLGAIKVERFYQITELLMIGYGCLFFGCKVPVIKGGFFSKNDYSYSVYIYSFPIQKIVINMMNELYLSPASLTVITIVLLVPFCWFSWNYVEKPCLKLKNKFVSSSSELFH